MMRIARSLIVNGTVWISCAASLCGCSHRDLSTPSKRMTGHWMTSSGYNSYITAIDPSTQVGNITSVNKDGSKDISQYKIIEEDADGERIVYTTTFKGTSITFTSFIPKDGRTRRLVAGTFKEPPPVGNNGPNILTYVDDKTAP